MTFDQAHDGMAVKYATEPMEHGEYTFGQIVRVGDRLMYQSNHSSLPPEELTPNFLRRLSPANECPWCGGQVRR